MLFAAETTRAELSAALHATRRPEHQRRSWLGREPCPAPHSFFFSRVQIFLFEYL